MASPNSPSPQAPQHANAVPVSGPLRQTGQVIPNRLYCRAPGMKRAETRHLAQHSADVARTMSPRLSGTAANGIKPYWGDGFFGVRWDRAYLWYQEQGISPFTMRNLAGKTIPMWVDDWTGEIARSNPKLETRITANGRRQVRIFRKVGKIGARKNVPVRDSAGRLLRYRSVPQSYPGAPGRIAVRQWAPQGNNTGRIAALISMPHVGVRWRHPGLMPREFMQHAIQMTALQNGISDTTVFATYARA